MRGRPLQIASQDDEATLRRCRQRERDPELRPRWVGTQFGVRYSASGMRAVLCRL